MTRSTVAASHRDRGRCRQNKRAADHTAQADKAQRITKKKRFQRFQRPRIIMKGPQERSEAYGQDCSAFWAAEWNEFKGYF